MCRKYHTHVFGNCSVTSLYFNFLSRKNLTPNYLQCLAAASLVPHGYLLLNHRCNFFIVIFISLLHRLFVYFPISLEYNFIFLFYFIVVAENKIDVNDFKHPTVLFWCHQYFFDTIRPLPTLSCVTNHLHYSSIELEHLRYFSSVLECSRYSVAIAQTPTTSLLLSTNKAVMP